MARQELDREDLIREATALRERVELEVAGLDGPVVIGFRENGAASVYFGAEPAYHFTTIGELRRAHLDGRLIKAEQRRLVALRRERRAGEVALLRHELDDEETAALLADLSRRLELLRRAVREGGFQLLRDEPPGTGVSRAQQWLSNLPQALAIAARPHLA